MPGYSVDKRTGAHLVKREKQLAPGKHVINRPKGLSSGHCFSNDLQITKEHEHYPNLLNADCLFSCVTTVRLRLDCAMLGNNICSHVRRHQ